MDYRALIFVALALTALVAAGAKPDLIADIIRGNYLYPVPAENAPAPLSRRRGAISDADLASPGGKDDSSRQ